MTLQFKRLSPGHYIATWRGGEVVILRELSIGLREEEVVWTVYVNGKSLFLSHETLRDAKEDANRHVNKTLSE